MALSKARQEEAKDLALVEATAEYTFDPYGYTMFAYPWGVSGTILAQHDGPDIWQAEEMDAIGKALEEARCTDTPMGAIRRAIASGHGIGKSAFASWIMRWFVACQPHANIVATSNTRTQLLTKLWRELSRWHGLAIDKHLFEWTATTYYHVEHPGTWKANAIPWSEQNSEAFAGLHEDNVMLLFDEASAIADSIWETAQGALTTRGALWLATGNPTRNTGYFRECFGDGRFAHRWAHRNIDSRTCKVTNKEQLQEWIDDYGEDSDFARVRVKGTFPRAGSTQFISGELVDNATKNRVVRDPDAQRVLAVDVARFGDDQTVLVRRENNYLLPAIKYRGLDTMEVANAVIQEIQSWSPDLVLVDGNGLGAGVVDRLRQLGYDVVDVQVGGKAEDELKYLNKRAECWGRMRDWLKGDVQIPDDKELREDLIGPEYGYNNKMQIQLESKKDMKKRGLRSPDFGDALAISFAESPNTRRTHKSVTRKSLASMRAKHSWRSR